jgi:hypothetical protein
MKEKQGQTQSLNVTSEELQAISFALQWNYIVTAGNSETQRQWHHQHKTINGVLKKIKALQTGAN